MKRNSSQTSNSASSASKSSKRQKTSQACTSCRKSKTRCEILENREQGTVKCHRCKVLKVHCSYQDMDKSELPMEESLRKPRVDNDANSSSRFSNAAVHAQTMQWEQRALAIIESANGSTLLKNITPEGQRSSTRRYMIWDWFRVPQGHVYDWTAPLDTVRELVNSVFDSEPKQAIAVAPSPESVANDSLAKVLTSDQIEHLLDLFSQYYTPWLNLTLIRTAENPMLDLVCCTISSRHLDEPTRSAVATRLQALTKDCCAKLIFQSRNSDSIEAIQCLLILSLWAPLCGNSEDFGDRRTLIGSAVSMAMNCHLNEACDKALKLQTAKKKGDEVDESDLIDAINRSRLWLSVANTESMLCIGSGRLALSKRNYEIYRDLFPTHPTLSLFPLDLDTGRDARLRLLSELCDAMETGLAIPFQSVSEDDVERWYDSLTHVFQNMARLLRLCLPLGVLADSEKFHYQMLVIQNKFFRLLLLHHALASCRTHQNENQSARATLWFQEIRPRGIFLVIAWSRESFQLSEAFLISILEMDSSLLRIAPDYLFTMIPFAAGYAISSNYFALKGLGVHIPGSTMRIIERIVVHLMQASVSEDSPARKCAQLISVMLALYNAKAKELTETPRRSVVDILGSYDPWLGTARKPESQIPDNSSTLSLPKMPEVRLSDESPSSSAPTPSTSSTSPSSTAFPATTPSSSSLDMQSPSSSSQSSMTRATTSSPAPPGISVVQDTLHTGLISPDMSFQNQPSYQRPGIQSYTQEGASMNTYANPSVLNTGQNTGPEHDLWPDIDMSSVNFGWMDNSLLQSSEFWNGVLVDMNVSGYEGLHLNTQGYQGYNPNFHGE